MGIKLACIGIRTDQTMDGCLNTELLSWFLCLVVGATHIWGKKAAQKPQSLRQTVEHIPQMVERRLWKTTVGVRAEAGMTEPSILHAQPRHRAQCCPMVHPAPSQVWLLYGETFTVCSRQQVIVWVGLSRGGGWRASYFNKLSIYVEREDSLFTAGML